MTLYVVSSIGLFAAVLAMRRQGGMVEGISELGGLMSKRPWLTIALSILIWSVAGLPPFGGFLGKWVVLEAGIGAGLYPLAIVLVLSSVVSLGYYLRLIKIMWFDEPTERFESVDSSVMLVVLSSALFVIVFMVFFFVLGGWTGQAALGITA
jgi:NADH-quinone oxidoreductase subunit N